MVHPISYQGFLDSLKQNKLHFVSGQSISIKGIGLLQEPAYVIESSGSVESKVFVHSLSSVQGACSAFLKTFKMTSEDKWGLCLSTAHVAGFSILARTYFGGLQEPHFFEWSKNSLVSEIEKNKISIMSLVPTQIFDLLKMGVTPPDCLRMVFVGGAKLSSDLRERMVRLGWPLVECYGSTETFAQMSYSLDGGDFKSFEGWSVDTKGAELLMRGPGLFTAQIKEGVYRTRKTDWFSSGDLVELDGDKFRVLGKSDGLIKIKGSYLDFNKLKNEFAGCLSEESLSPLENFLLCLKEDRGGAGVYMVATSPKSASLVMKKLKIIRGAFYIQNVERSALGKVKATNLSSVLRKTVLSL